MQAATDLILCMCVCVESLHCHLFENHDLIEEVNTLAGEELPDGLLPLEARRLRGGGHLERPTPQELHQRAVLSRDGGEKRLGDVYLHCRRRVCMKTPHTATVNSQPPLSCIEVCVCVCLSVFVYTCAGLTCLVTVKKFWFLNSSPLTAAQAELSNPFSTDTCLLWKSEPRKRFTGIPLGLLVGPQSVPHKYTRPD